MATTISVAALTVTITEAITLNGSDMGATNTLSVPAVAEISQRIVSVDASNVRTLFEFSTVVGSGTYVKANVAYLRITNLDNEYSISLNLESSASNFWLVLAKGQSFMLSKAAGTLEADDDTTIAAPTLQDLVKISGHAAQAIDLDCYIALT